MTRISRCIFPALLLAAAGQSLGQTAVAPPSDIIGFTLGADYRLPDWETITGYCRYLAADCDRVSLMELGPSTEGRPMIALAITAEENMARLEDYRKMVLRLADPRQLSPAESERLIEAARAVVLIGCNIHATEIASASMAMELAWDLATREDPEARLVRREVILLLVPSLNPDGLDLVVDWYRRTLGTPYEGTAPPVIYHPYTGHDNNRDWFMITQKETRIVSRLLYYDWTPQIVYDVHQMGGQGARFFVPPFFDPVNPHIDPLLLCEVAAIGDHMALSLLSSGKAGVIDHAMYDTWWHGGFRTVPYRHNMVGLLTEAAGANIASPVFVPYRSLRGETRGLPSYRPGVNFPLPWPGGWWRIGDIIDYEMISSWALLTAAARYRTLFLRNFYRLGLKQVRSARANPPHAYIVPTGQDDPPSAVELLRVLARAGIEIQRAAGPFSAGGIDYPEGTYLVPLDQPFGAHVRDLLEIQNYPDRRLYPGGPPEQPYDVTGWTLGLQMGVRTVEMTDTLAGAELESTPPIIPLPPGQVSGSGDWFAADPHPNNAFRAANILISRGLAASRALQRFTAAGKTWPPGTFLVRAAGGDIDRLRAVADTLGIDFTGIGRRPESIGYQEFTPPALGLYKPWTGNIDEGWTRWVLECFDFPYRSLGDARVRAGSLYPDYRAIVIPDMSEDQLSEGVPPGYLPPQYTGGLGREGVTALERFVRDGGTLICLDSSGGAVARLFGLPVDDIAAAQETDEEKAAAKRFNCPGSLLRLELTADHPLVWGMGESCAVYFSAGPIYRIRETKEDGRERAAPRATAVGRYPGTNPLLSGWISGEEFIQGQSALVECPLGKGRVVLIGFRAQHRAQTWGTFKILFNAIYYRG